MSYIGKSPANVALAASDIADGAITTAKIAADAVTDAKIADDVVGTEHLTANEVDTTALGADAVTGAQLADNAVNSEHYTDASIDLAHMSINSIDSDQYVDGSIDTAHIADAQINEAKMLISNAPTNGYFLSAQSGNTGGMTWVEVPAADFSAVGEHLLPSTDDTYDLGSAVKQWRNIYTGDLHLSNESKSTGNSVDGTNGNWTIQEGNDDLFILNNKSGKKYKFKLEEI